MDKNNLVYTSEEITNMCDTWVNFQGFSGETCSKCKIKINVFAYGSGWICPCCDSYNAQSFNHANIPHELPDVGTPLSVVKDGISKSKSWVELIK